MKNLERGPRKIVFSAFSRVHNAIVEIRSDDVTIADVLNELRSRSAPAEGTELARAVLLEPSVRLEALPEGITPTAETDPRPIVILESREL